MERARESDVFGNIISMESAQVAIQFGIGQRELVSLYLFYAGLRNYGLAATVNPAAQDHMG